MITWSSSTSRVFDVVTQRYSSHEPYLLTRNPLTADKMVHKTMIKAKICILENV